MVNPVLPATKPASVSVSGLVKGYGPVLALRGISFEVGGAEILGLLGPNGAGKTTLLECILGLRRPDKGAILLSGIDALAQPEWARYRMGGLIQGATLQERITPREALNFFGSFYRVPTEPDMLLSQFGLTEKADAPFESLSAGQRQRLFLALSLVNRPSLILLDEPTIGLDPCARRELHELIVELRSAGKTVILSTHDMEEAEVLCDRVAIINNGNLLAIGSPAELINRHGISSRVEFRSVLPVSPEQLRAVRKVSEYEHVNGFESLRTDDPTATIASLIVTLATQDNALLELRIAKSSLEDVFLALTGKAWGDGP